ncbi:MAG: UDP-N-acetylmuramoyl-L-alanyl-D-glutamate--2,6-diaminopimelate ligase, partial [Bacteroidetes bacterium]
MKLEDIIQGIEITTVSGDTGGEVRDIVFDSRQAGAGSLFVAIRGYETDGHLFIGQALSNGAFAVICEDEPTHKNPAVTWIRVKDSRRALALAAAAFHGHPSRELHLVGVTGTNGKTTIASLLHSLHTLLGFRSGLLSTIQVLIGGEVHPATHTTPDPVRLNALLRQMVD